jgi:hypothetical protein
MWPKPLEDLSNMVEVGKNPFGEKNKNVILIASNR